MTPAKATPERQFDLRTIEKELQRGTVSKAEWAAYLKSLPDSASQADHIDVDFESVTISTDDHTPHLTSLTFTTADTDS